MDKFGHAKLCDFGATTEQELGVDWVGTPEYASPEAIENVFNSKFKKFHAPRATDDLFSLGLVMFFIGAGATAEELVKHYATVRTAVCSDESFQVLRRTRSLYGKFLRHYYTSGYFRSNLKTFHCQLGIENLFFWMFKLVQLLPKSRLTLDKLLETSLFQTAVKLSADLNARDVHYKEELEMERRQVKDLVYQNGMALANVASLEKELSLLRDGQQQVVAERDRLQTAAKQRDNRLQPLRLQIKELEQRLKLLQMSHHEELLKLSKQKDAEIASADQLQMYSTQEASECSKKAEAALEERNRSQEKAATLQSQLEAYQERIANLEDQIHTLTSCNVKLPIASNKTHRHSTFASSNSANFVQLAMDVSGIQEHHVNMSEEVGSLNHILDGFQPPPLNSPTALHIDPFAALQMELDANAGRDTFEPAVIPASLVSDEEAVNSALFDPTFALIQQQQVDSVVAVAPMIQEPLSSINASAPMMNSAAVWNSSEGGHASIMIFAAGQQPSATSAPIPESTDEHPERAAEAVTCESAVLEPNGIANPNDAIAGARTTTDQRLDEMDTKVEKIFTLLQKIQHPDLTAPTPPVCALQPPPQPDFLSQVITPRPIQASTVRVDATSNVPLRHTRNQHRVAHGGKAPRELEDIFAYQRAHQDDSFAEADSNEKDQSICSGLQFLQNKSKRAQAISPSKQSNVVYNFKKQKPEIDTDFDETGKLSPRDNAMGDIAVEAEDAISIDSKSDEDMEQPDRMKVKSNKAKVQQYKSMFII